MAALTTLITQTTENPQSTDFATFGSLGDCKITSGVIAPVTAATTSGAVSTTSFTLTDNASTTEALTARWTFGTPTTGSTIRLIYSYADANNYYYIEVKPGGVTVSANAADVRDKVTLWKRVAGTETEITAGFIASPPWPSGNLYRQIESGDMRLETIVSGTTIRATHVETQHFIEFNDVPIIHVADSALADGGKVGYSFIGSAHTNTLTNVQAQKIKTLWTSSTGADSGTGSRTDPFLTFSKAPSVINVNEMAIYRANSFSSGAVIARVAATSREEGPMCFVYKGETVTYTPPGVDSDFLTLSSTSCKYWKFHGFTCNGSTNKGRFFIHPLNQSTDHTFTGWMLSGSGATSILLTPETGPSYAGRHIIRDNIIYQPGLNTSGDHGIYCSCTDSEISYNWLDGQSLSAGYGIHVFSSSSNNGCDNTTTRWNRVLNFPSTTSAGIILSNGTGIVSKGDHVSGCYVGVQLWHDADGAQLEYAIVTGNTSHGVSMGGFNATNCLAANCTITGNGGYGVWGETLNVGGLVKNCIRYNNTSGAVGGTNMTSTTCLDTNPDFVDAGSGDYHLLDTSNAIGAGTDLSSSISTLDFDGRVVPQDTLWQIGAFAETVPPDNPPVWSISATYAATTGQAKTFGDMTITDPEGDVTYVDFILDNTTSTLSATNSGTGTFEGAS